MPNKVSKRVKTLKSFMEWAEQFNDGEYVFRGVSNEKYIIEASTYRRLKNRDGNFRKQEDGTLGKLLKINEEMVEDARRQGHGRDMKDLELLAELQHRGAATCLIDFTKNPLVALWMACREGSGGSANGKVFAVDISSQVTFEPVTTKLSQEEDIDYFFEQNKNNGYQLYQWQPDYQRNRMLAQQSVFLFGGGRIESAAECIILKNSKQEIWNSLKKSASITEGSLFPDFDGFASQRAQNKAYVEPDAHYYFMRGLSAFTESKMDEAIDYYSKGISLNPNKVVLSMLHVWRAFVNERKENYRLAVKDYNKVIELTPDYPGIYFHRGIAKTQLKQYEDALTDYDEAIRLKPDEADEANIYAARGAAKSKLGQHEEAIINYDEAIRLAPNEAAGYNNRGRAKFELGQHEEAIVDYDEAIRLKPDGANSYAVRGTAKFELGQHEEAIVDYDEAIRLKPDGANIYAVRGTAKFELGQYEEAIVDYDEVIRLKPEEANIYAPRGAAKSELGQYEEAIVDYDEAIRLKPEEANIYAARGAAKSELGQHEEAIIDYDEAIRLKPDEADIYVDRGAAKSELGQHEEAIIDCDEAIRLAPNEAAGYNNRGWAKVELGQYEEAIIDCDEAIRLAPNEAAGYFNRGAARLEIRCFSEAEQDLQTALQLAERSGDAERVTKIEAKLDELKSLIGKGNSEDK